MPSSSFLHSTSSSLSTFGSSSSFPSSPCSHSSSSPITSPKGPLSLRISHFNFLSNHILTYLSSQPLIDFVTLNANQHLPRHDIFLWEKSNFPYKLPPDLISFYSVFNGIDLKWGINLSKKEEYGGGSTGGSNNNNINNYRNHHIDSITKDKIGGNVHEGNGNGSSNGNIHCDDSLYCYSSERLVANSNGTFPRTTNNALVGEISLLPLKNLTRITLDPNDIKVMEVKAAITIPSRRAELSKLNNEGIAGLKQSNTTTTTTTTVNNNNRYCACFLLESNSRVGKVVLAYRSTSTNTSTIGSSSNQSNCFSQEVWLQDLSGDWWYLGESFSSYYRMLLVHLGIIGWQSNFTCNKTDAVSMQWMRLFIPERLHVDRVGMEKELKQYQFYRHICKLRDQKAKQEREKFEARKRQYEQKDHYEKSSDDIHQPCTPSKANHSILYISQHQSSIHQSPSLLPNDYIQNYYRGLMESGDVVVNPNIYNYRAKNNKNSSLSKSLAITNPIQKQPINVNLNPSPHNNALSNANMNYLNPRLLSVNHEKEKTGKSLTNSSSHSSSKGVSSSLRRPSSRSSSSAGLSRRSSK